MLEPRNPPIDGICTGRPYVVAHVAALEIADHVDGPSLGAERVAEILSVAVLARIVRGTVVAGCDGRAERHDTQGELTGGRALDKVGIARFMRTAVWRVRMRDAGLKD